MKNGNTQRALLFKRKSFWMQFFWVFVMFAGVGMGCVFDAAVLFVAFVIIAFFGLTESSRWSQKKNLIVCAAAAVLGSVCGAFSVFETVSVFVLLFTAGGLILYYRNRSQKFIPIIEEFASEIAQETNLIDLVRTTTEKIKNMTQEDEVFILIADSKGGLYKIEGIDSLQQELTRNGGVVWKVFASGRPYVTGQIEPSKDLPLCREARSLMSVALSARGEGLGVLQVESRTAEVFSEGDLKSLSLIAFVFSQLLCGFLKDAHNVKIKEDAAI